MNQIDTLQIILQPVLYAAYAWIIAIVIAIAACIISRVIESLRMDWERIQQRKTYSVFSSTPSPDLRRIARQYGLNPTQQRADLIAAIYNFHQQRLRRTSAILQG